MGVAAAAKPKSKSGAPDAGDFASAVICHGAPDAG